MSRLHAISELLGVSPQMCTAQTALDPFVHLLLVLQFHQVGDGCQQVELWKSGGDGISRPVMQTYLVNPFHSAPSREREKVLFRRALFATTITLCLRQVLATGEKSVDCHRNGPARL